MRKNGKAKNLILVLAVLVLVTVLSAVGVKGAFPDTIALEQSARCGMEEHVHSEECYVGDILVCREKMHTHTENCYIVLLADNDINELLTRVDVAPDNNLESLISATVLQASLATNLKANVNFDGPVASVSPSPSLTPSISPSLFPSISPSLFPSISPSLTPSISPSLIPTMSPSPSISPSADPTMTPSASPSQAVTENKPLSVTQQAHPITNEQIVALNSSVDTSQQGVVLNEHLVTFNLTAGASEEELLAELLNGEKAAGDVSTLAVGGTGSNSNNTINFYIRLDGEITFVSSGNLSSSSYRYYSYANTVKAYTDYVVTGLATNNINGTYYFRYNRDSGTATSFNRSPTYYGSQIYFANRSNAQSAVLSWKSNSTDPVDFYTVTLNYSAVGSANQTKYVQESYTYTLPTSDEYYWEDSNGNEITDLRNLTKATTVYAKPRNYTATFENSDGAEIVTSINGKPTDGKLTITLPAMPAAYPDHIWVVKGGDGTELQPGTQYTMTGSTTFVAKLKSYTVNFNTDGGSAVGNQTVNHGSTAARPADPTKTGYTFKGWYTDAGCTDGNEYDFSTQVKQNTTLYAKWEARTYTVTYVDGGTTYTTEAKYNQTIKLRDEILNGTYWVNGNSVYEPGDDYTVTGDITFTATDKVGAFFYYINGTSDARTVTPGTQITLPTLSGTNVWVDEEGTIYAGGATVTLSGNKSFTERETLKITYNVNFYNSTGLSSNSYWSPVLTGTELTSATVTVVQGANTALYSVTPRAYASDLSGGEAAYFLGWQPASSTGTTLEPGTNLSWDELKSYAQNGTVTLNGQWNRDSANNKTDVRFFIRFDSSPPDFGSSVGNRPTDYYTGQLYLSYAGNANNTSFNIVDETPDNSYSADQNIRKLVGDKGDGELWISAVPDDAWVFEQLKTYTRENQTSEEIQANKYLRVEYTDSQGNTQWETVLADELDTDHYCVRWYVFKKENDGWHIDGRLVKKQGTIVVDKIFGGETDAIDQARDGFYILAENGTYDPNTDKFTPYNSSHEKYSAYILVLNPQASTQLGQQQIAAAKAAYPKAVVKVIDTEKNLENEIVDGWQITDVTLGEYWRFTEHAVHPSYTNVAGNKVNYSWYAEYTVIDSDGEDSRVAEFGSWATVVGKTYAMDTDASQGLTVDFTNYYYDSDSILVRKIDGDTGLPLGGAEFQLWQGGLQLKFTDAGDGIYNVDPEGTIGSIVTNSEGFSVITIKDFSYEAGDLVVKEVTAPSGYSVVNDITIGYLDGKGEVAGIKAIVGAEPDQFDYHAEYHDENGGVLIVKDHASHYTSVTVDKVWAGAARTDSVEISLLANGKNATLLFPTLNSTVVLNNDNGWTHTWENLPAYGNGELVEWSVKEVKIGTDTTMVGSDTFASWIVSYSAPTKTYDAEGNVANWAYTVSNTVRRTLIYLTKVDNSGAAVPGVQFSLTPVEARNGVWRETGGTVLTATSDGTGQILFDNLNAGVYYRLSEDIPAAGYIPAGDIVISIDGVGVVTQAVIDAGGKVTKVELNTATHQYTNPYNIKAINFSGVELPSTGGSGTINYTLGGLLLMAAALLMLYKRSRRKEDAPYV